MAHALAGLFGGLWEVAAEGYERSENRVKDTLEHVRRSRLSVAAEAGIDATTGKLENVIEFFLQKAEEQSVRESAGATKEESPATLFAKVRVFTVTTFQRVYDQTLQIVQAARDRGWEIAGLTTKGPEQPSLLGSLAQNLQTAYLSTVLLVKSTPSLAWNAAGQLLRISSVRKAASELPNHMEQEDASPGPTGDHPDSTGEQEGAQSEAALAPEGWGLGPGQDVRRLSRGHYPLPFINLDDPLPPQPAASGRSAFSPYKEGAGRRRWSEGLFRFSSEALYQRALYAGLYGTPFKKD
ncbi:hypothetical protein JRQ81_006682 [Phrynocephalus forsythii]|uniref:Uncharacterized protein n=1 Tax=Phrynocephalus forsythii TaxID=171643 RepID=A0A9Q0XDG2_9SAUR|nr:hypothetical protein JRQ81_006682 [Phrynocephalus forsythii]